MSNHPESAPGQALIGTGYVQLDVVAAVIERGESVLICRRPPGKKHGGLWEFPGGKVDPGETFPKAVTRELREELDVDAEHVGDVLFSVADSQTGYVIHFVATRIIGEPTALEHSEIAWCERAQLPNYALAPSDRAFVDFAAREE